MRGRAVLALAFGVLALAAGGCGGAEEVAPTAETVAGELPEETVTGTEEAETGTGVTETATRRAGTGAAGTAETGEETSPTGTGGAETGGAETGGAETGETGTGTTEAAGDAAAGKAIFNSAGCGSCHVLKAAGSSGTAGPNLDESNPDMEEAVNQIANGGGGMPPFKGQLSEEEINNVAAFVVESAGG